MHFLINRYMTLVCYYCVLFTISLIACIPLFYKGNNRPLAFPIWTPGDLVGTKYWVFYVFELVTLFLCCAFVVCQDVLVTGILLQICKQYDFLASRFRNLKIDCPKIQFNRLIQHHVCIYK